MAQVFEPEAIEAFRRHVDARTTTITVTYCFVGLALGLLVAAGLFGREGQLNWWVNSAVALLGATTGWVVGCERSFMLRLQAQMTLFQAHIEANTEPTTGFDGAPTQVNPPNKSLLVKAGLRIN